MIFILVHTQFIVYVTLQTSISIITNFNTTSHTERLLNVDFD